MNAAADLAYARARRRYVRAWLALLVLLLASALGAQIHLGAGNLVVSLVIAAIKTGVVGWVFMALDEASLMQRIAVCAGAAGLLVLVALSSVDFAPRRHDEPVSWQQPQAVPARLQQTH